MFDWMFEKMIDAEVYFHNTRYSILHERIEEILYLALKNSSIIDRIESGILWNKPSYEFYLKTIQSSEIGDDYVYHNGNISSITIHVTESAWREIKNLHWIEFSNKVV